MRAASPVTTDYDIRLSPTPDGQAARALGRRGKRHDRHDPRPHADEGLWRYRAESLATSSGRIAIVMPQGTMWARNIQLSELDVGVFVQKLFEKKLDRAGFHQSAASSPSRCATASRRPIRSSIDTQKNVILGRGSFNFKDESLDLDVRADRQEVQPVLGPITRGRRRLFRGTLDRPDQPCAARARRGGRGSGRPLPAERGLDSRATRPTPTPALRLQRPVRRAADARRSPCSTRTVNALLRALQPRRHPRRQVHRQREDQPRFRWPGASTASASSTPAPRASSSCTCRAGRTSSRSPATATCCPRHGAGFIRLSTWPSAPAWSSTSPGAASAGSSGRPRSRAAARTTSCR